MTPSLMPASTATSSPTPTNTPLPVALSDWERIEFRGGPVEALAIDPVTPATLYALTRDGVVKTTDGGESWRTINTDLTYSDNPYADSALEANNLIIVPATPPTLYAESADRVLKSTDGGMSWVATSAPSGLVFDPVTPTTLYAGASSGLKKSADGGKTWSKVTILPEDEIEYAVPLAVDPATPSTLYAGVQGSYGYQIQGGLYKTTDGGESWVNINPTTGTFYVRGLVIDPIAPSTLYAYEGIRVYRSTDGGRSWNESDTGLDLGWLDANNPIGIYKLVVDPAIPANLYAATDKGVYKSTDSGGKWTLVNTGLPASRVRTLVIDPLTPTTLYAGTPLGFLKSTNGGEEWADASPVTNQASVSALAIDPVNPTTFYAGIDHRLYKSIDSGGKWQMVDLAPQEIIVHGIVIDPTTPTTLYADVWENGGLPNGGGLYKSMDGGETWSNTSPFDSIYALALDPLTPATLYEGDMYGGVGKTTNGGRDWPVYTGLGNSPVCALAIDPATPITLYAGTGCTLPVEDYDLYKSMDGGESWRGIVLAGPHHPGIWALVIDPVAPATLYAGTWRGLFKSTDAGETWAATGLPDFRITALAIHPVTTTTLYAGTEGYGMYKSMDGGQTWVNIGLANMGAITLAFDPATPTTLYAGTFRNGLFVAHHIE